MARRIDLSERTYGDIAERLNWHMRFEGLDQAGYAKRAGFTRQQVGNWMAGTGRIGLDGALKLHDIFGLSLDWIYLGDAETLPISLRKAWLDHQSNAA